MITGLKELTIDKFIELVSGDKSVLNPEGDKVEETELLTATRNIIFEYREIADPAGVRSYLMELEDLIKERISVAVLNICRNLIDLGEIPAVRGILAEMGIRVRHIIDRRLPVEVNSMLEKSKREIARIEEGYRTDGRKSVDIRRDFEAQTAALMAHYKFQIDMATMRATLYAELVGRYNREIKARMATLKK